MLCIDSQKLSFMKLYLTIIAFVDFVIFRKSFHILKAMDIYTYIFYFFYDFIFYIKPCLSQEYVKEWLILLP